jgi:hypothetical protein
MLLPSSYSRCKRPCGCAEGGQLWNCHSCRGNQTSGFIQPIGTLCYKGEVPVSDEFVCLGSARGPAPELYSPERIRAHAPGAEGQPQHKGLVPEP